MYSSVRAPPANFFCYLCFVKIVFSLPGLCCFRTCIPYRTSDKKWRPKFEIYQDIMSTKGLSGGFTACKAWRLWHLFLPTYPAKLDSNFCVLGRGTRIALNLMFLLDCFASFFFAFQRPPKKVFYTFPVVLVRNGNRFVQARVPEQLKCRQGRCGGASILFRSAAAHFQTCVQISAVKAFFC